MKVFTSCFARGAVISYERKWNRALRFFVKSRGNIHISDYDDIWYWLDISEKRWALPIYPFNALAAESLLGCCAMSSFWQNVMRWIKCNTLTVTQLKHVQQEASKYNRKNERVAYKCVTIDLTKLNEKNNNKKRWHR